MTVLFRNPMSIFIAGNPRIGDTGSRIRNRRTANVDANKKGVSVRHIPHAPRHFMREPADRRSVAGGCRVPRSETEAISLAAAPRFPRCNKTEDLSYCRGPGPA